MEIRDFDDILNRLGSGKWNFVYFIAVSSCTFWLPSVIIAGMYVAPSTDFMCDPPSDIMNITEIEKCTFTTGVGENREEHECTEWIYDQSDSAQTLTSEFDLVCSKAYLRPIYQTAYMIGNIVGSPINGVLSDKLGRKFIISITTISGIFSILISFVFHRVIWIIFMRFLAGLCFHSMLLSSYALFMEVCEPRHRSTAGILFTLPWAFGTMWWGFLGYMLRDWRWLQSASIAPSIIILICLCIYDESPRWLIIRGRFEEALNCLKKAAKWNRTTLPPDESLRNTMQVIFMSSSVAEPETQIDDRSCVSRFLDSIRTLLYLLIVLFKTSELRRITLLMYLVFFVAGNVFYGLSLNADNFDLDPYLYMVFTGATQLPAYAFTGHIIGKFGRIKPTCSSFLLCGILVLTLAFIPSEYKLTIYILATLGSMTIAAAFQIVFLLATEVFPTEVRLQGFGTSSFLSSVGGGTAPFITDSLGGLFPWAPSLVFGVLSTAAGIGTFFIPETLDLHLPETIEKLEEEATKRKPRAIAS